jgi:uncharacterized membrane protein
MVQKDFCQNCRQKHDCREVYRRMGNATCPSILLKAITAFLLPLIVFIVSLAVFDKIFTRAGESIFSISQNSNLTNAQKLQTVIGFLMALLITFICVSITRTINKKFD